MPKPPKAEAKLIPVGVSGCLLGQKVRYNGADKFDPFVVNVLGTLFQWTSVCPEAEAGFGVPRESMRLVQRGGKNHLVTVKTEKDLTGPMLKFSKKRVHELSKLGLRGFLLKKNSPSCGMERVKVYRKDVPFNDGRGLFAEALLAAFPNLPVEEEGRLKDPNIRENWVSRVYAYHELRNLFESKWSVGGLVKFHRRYKMKLLSHSFPVYGRLGQLVAQAKELTKKELETEYERTFMGALALHASRRKHVNVLQHMMGHLKKQLDSETKQDILTAIDDYKNGIYPLSVPLTLLKHFVQKHQIDYLLDQVYFEPHPKKLALL